MPEVLPLKGIRFVQDRVGTFSKVITPPFDVISPELRENLAQLSPFNMVHLILPKEAAGKNRYESAASLFEEWKKAGVLCQDEEESFYILEQTFRGLDGVERTRTAIVARVRLPEKNVKRQVLDHERTFPHKIEDRLQLMTATKAQLEVVFLLYEDKKRRLHAFMNETKSREPDVLAETADGVRQRLWRTLANPDVTEFFADKTLYIADGHHRFRTAMTYRDLMRTEDNPGETHPWDYALVALVDCEDPGLVIWPTHRLVDPPDDFDVGDFFGRIRQNFEVQELPHDISPGTFMERIQHAPACAIGLAIHSYGNYLLTLPEERKTRVLGQNCPPLWADLDVVILHKGIIESVLGLPSGAELLYEPDATKALTMVAQNKKQIAFLVKAVTPNQVRICAEAGIYMPEKATYFFPKVPSGAVIYPLD